MRMIVATVLMLSMAFMAISQVVRSRRRGAANDRRMSVSLCLLLSGVAVVSADMLASGNGVSLKSVAMDIMPCVLAMWLVTSTLYDFSVTKWTIRTMEASVFVLILFHILRMADVVPDIPDCTAVAVVSCLASASPLLLVYGLARQMRNVKSVMKNGSVWTVVCLVVDVVYMCFIIAGTALVQVGWTVPGLLMAGGVIVALGYRMQTDSMFVIWQNQERLIVESMKLTSLPSVTDGAQIEDVYKELYERIVTYFEVGKPYLDHDLTINTVVKELFSNKLYVSKAISQFTGRNFCQFVNYYRIMHSVESFRENPEHKIHELACLSGFNSIVSYNMAFRLFMGENPSEWCRKERAKLIKKPK